MNKKGLFFWIELILLVVVITLIVLGFPRSQDGGFLASKDSLDMEKLGFTTLQSLDNAGIFETYINPGDFTQSNFTAILIYTREALPSAISSDLEYFNGTNCSSETGTLLAVCGNVTRTKDTSMAEYAYAKTNPTVTIRLYLRRILG
jgi:hypothetical protein